MHTVYIDVSAIEEPLLLADICENFLVVVKRGGLQEGIHLQCAFRSKGYKARQVHDLIMQAIGWNITAPPQGAHIMMKTLKQQGIHTWIGILGYLEKERDEPYHFRIVCRKGVWSDDDLSQGVWEYAKYGAPFKERTMIDYKNVLQRVALFHDHIISPIDRPWIQEHPELVLLRILYDAIRQFPSVSSVDGSILRTGYGTE
jgi:hypothetical protein